jgi:hypothetical protein
MFRKGLEKYISSEYVQIKFLFVKYENCATCGLDRDSVFRLKTETKFMNVSFVEVSGHNLESSQT